MTTSPWRWAIVITATTSVVGQFRSRSRIVCPGFSRRIRNTSRLARYLGSGWRVGTTSLEHQPRELEGRAAEDAYHRHSERGAAEPLEAQPLLSVQASPPRNFVSATC